MLNGRLPWPHIDKARHLIHSNSSDWEFWWGKQSYLELLKIHQISISDFNNDFLTSYTQSTFAEYKITINYFNEKICKFPDTFLEVSR